MMPILRWRKEEADGEHEKWEPVILDNMKCSEKRSHLDGHACSFARLPLFPFSRCGT